MVHELLTPARDQDIKCTRTCSKRKFIFSGGHQPFLQVTSSKGMDEKGFVNVPLNSESVKK